MCSFSTGEVKIVETKAKVIERVSKKEVQVNEQVAVQRAKECDVVKAGAPAAHVGLQKSTPVKNNTHQATPTHAQGKRPEHTSEEHSSQHNKETKACVVKRQEREVDVNISKQHRANVTNTDQVNKDSKGSNNLRALVNGAVKGEDSVLMNNNLTVEVSKQSLHVFANEGKAKGGSQVEVIRATVTPLPVGHLSPPIIKLEPLDVKGSCDEVQSMEVR